MMLFLILLFPIIEIYLTVKFIQQYSFIDFIFATITSGLLGFWVMTFVGKGALVNLQTGLMTGNSNLSKIAIHKGIMAFGGLLLFIPGLFSDIISIFFILPGSSHLIVWYLRNKFKNGLSKGFQFSSKNSGLGGFKFYSSTNINPQGFRNIDPQGFSNINSQIFGNFQSNPIEKDVTNSLNTEAKKTDNVIQIPSKSKKD